MARESIFSRSSISGAVDEGSPGKPVSSTVHRRPFGSARQRARDARHLRLRGERAEFSAAFAQRFTDSEASIEDAHDFVTDYLEEISNEYSKVYPGNKRLVDAFLEIAQAERWAEGWSRKITSLKSRMESHKSMVARSTPKSFMAHCLHGKR